MEDKYMRRWLIRQNGKPRLVQCEKCPRLGWSVKDCFSLEYCRRSRIPFTCGSCKFPQYEHTLCSPVRGNVNRIYGGSKN